MEIEFIEQVAPSISRGPGVGRTAEPWEIHLAPLKSDEMAGKEYRLWTYESRSAATSRANSVRNRLWKIEPESDYVFKIRTLPDSSGFFGVYGIYHGVLDAETVAEKRARKEERAERIASQRAAAAKITEVASVAPDASVASVAPDASDETPAQRVAKARSRKAS